MLNVFQNIIILIIEIGRRPGKQVLLYTAGGRINHTDILEGKLAVSATIEVNLLLVQVIPFLCICFRCSGLDRGAICNILIAKSWKKENSNVNDGMSILWNIMLHLRGMRYPIEKISKIHLEMNILAGHSGSSL